MEEPQSSIRIREWLPAIGSPIFGQNVRHVRRVPAAGKPWDSTVEAKRENGDFPCPLALEDEASLRYFAACEGSGLMAEEALLRTTEPPDRAAKLAALLTAGRSGRTGIGGCWRKWRKAILRLRRHFG